MRAPDINAAVRSSLAELVGYADELRDLDQALGDGDLGITVSLGAEAVVAALEALPEDTTPSLLARECAKAFANANPSTMAALVAGGLLAGSKVWADAEDIDVAAAGRFARAAGENIAQRGKTQLGDKTILDSIMPAADALERAQRGPHRPGGGDRGRRPRGRRHQGPPVPPRPGLLAAGAQHRPAGPRGHRVPAVPRVLARRQHRHHPDLLRRHA